MYCLSYFKVGLTYFEVEVIQRKLCVPLRLCVSALKRRLRRQTARRRLQVSGAGYGEVFDFAPPDDAVVREDWRRHGRVFEDWFHLTRDIAELSETHKSGLLWYNTENIAIP